MVDHWTPEQQQKLEDQAEEAIEHLLGGMESLEAIKAGMLNQEQWEVFCEDHIGIDPEHADALIDLGREMRGEAIRGRKP